MNIPYWIGLIALAIILGIWGYNAGKAKTRKFLQITTIVLVIGALAVGVMYPNSGIALSGGKLTTFSIGGVQESNQATDGGNGINIVTTNPTVTVNGFNSQYTGTTFATQVQASVNGGAFGSITTAVPGQTLDLLVSNTSSGYHAQIVKGLVVKADTFPLSLGLNKNASVKITAFNTNNVAIDNVATNQTVTVGQSPTMDVKFVGTSQANTQDMICVLEENNKTAVDSVKGITMDGSTPLTGIPLNFYTLSGVNSYVQVVEIPALTSSAEIHHAITVNTATTSGYTLANSTLKTTCYTKENFVDSATGKLAYDIQDSAGTLKSIAGYTKTINFDA